MKNGNFRGRNLEGGWIPRSQGAIVLNELYYSDAHQIGQLANRIIEIFLN